MFAWIFKILAVITSIVTTALLTVESARRGLIIASTIFGIVKIAVIVLFFAILAIILYLLLKDAAPPSIEEVQTRETAQGR